MSAKFVTDENLRNSIIQGLLRRQPQLDIVRVQDVGLRQADDPIVLNWAAQEGRILLTHDVNTITRYAYERLESGLMMAGVIEIRQDTPIGQVIEDILLLAEFPDECEGQIRYIPL